MANETAQEIARAFLREQKAFTRSLRERVAALAMRDADVFRGFLDDFRAEHHRQLQEIAATAPDHLKPRFRVKAPSRPADTA
ncbi:hypothetical protein [Sinorhizobium meliloti]|uniref:hypothetical protein n=1 Tax=Rhizobium meliloti TaxID=382 RepID=UPI000B499022|nr:hypothetical protein [Sinorhizobium meliloti]ASP68314.1 hypothetical protein CDO29_28090 [Sinorhizobium meliloti]MQX00661.1 hypothetical protein [Sinorhizobium meliloti]RVK54286.1 hypothetical protein CN160_04625 [Sinorhizobium meliloti]